MNRWRAICVVCFLVSIFMFVMNHIGFCAQASSGYPKAAVELVVPFAPGGGTDVVARVYAKFLSEKWGQPVNVVNKAGGNTVIGTNYVMQAAPDGYVILMDGAGSSSLQIGVKGLPFKVEERTFLCRNSAQPGVFLVPASSPWKDLKDVEAAAKRDPGNFSWASLGGGSSADLQLYTFFAVTGIPLGQTKRVVFPGAQPAAQAVAGGHVQFGASGGGGALSLINAGKVRAIAITSNKRLGILPNTPTTAESGFPEVDTLYWMGFSGPAGLPEEVVKAWTQAVEQLHKDPKVVTQLENITNYPVYLGPSEFKKFVLSEGERAMKFMIK